jgi:quinol monooxygenase YgiN
LQTLPRRQLLQAALAVAAGLAVNMAPAQTEGSSGVAYVVTYLEVAPDRVTEAVDLLKAEREAGRSDTGALRYQTLQRLAPRNHFVILEEWRDAAAQEGHAASARVRSFRERIGPMLISAYDERLHSALAVEPSSPEDRGLFVVTHVDIIPTQREVGVGLVTELVARSRSDEGNLRIDALTQNSRTNHMTVVETWENELAQQRHAATAHVKAFREALLPLSGSLYDERLYRSIP